MNGFLVSGQKLDHNIQIEIELKPEVKDYKLQFLSQSVRHDQWMYSIYTQCVNSATKSVYLMNL